MRAPWAPAERDVCVHPTYLVSWVKGRLPGQQTFSGTWKAVTEPWAWAFLSLGVLTALCQARQGQLPRRPERG